MRGFFTRKRNGSEKRLPTRRHTRCGKGRAGEAFHIPRSVRLSWPRVATSFQHILYSLLSSIECVFYCITLFLLFHGLILSQLILCFGFIDSVVSGFRFLVRLFRALVRFAGVQINAVVHSLSPFGIQNFIYSSDWKRTFLDT